jgi:hypothetical protein
MVTRSGLGDASSSLAASALNSGISAGVSLATTAASLWLSSIQLSHTADTATSQIVNGLAPKLQAIVDAYMAGPGTCQDQAAAMAAYLSAIDWLYSAAGCGNGAYGSAGNACISDRFGPGGPTDTNAKYPWAAYYYWPIANDPRASGCAAQVAADNPNAALQAAIANVSNPGSTQQATAGLFDTSGASSSASVPVVSASGIPAWVWLAAAGVGLVLILK